MRLGSEGRAVHHGSRTQYRSIEQSSDHLMVDFQRQLTFKTSNVRPLVRSKKSSNSQKIARMARNSTIFGSNESSRRDLFLEKFSKEQNNRKVFEKLRKIFEKIFDKFFEQCNLMGDVILSNASLLESKMLRFSRLLNPCKLKAPHWKQIQLK